MFRDHVLNVIIIVANTTFTSGAGLHFLSSNSARHQFTLQDNEYRASASHSVPVYIQAFAITHRIYTEGWPGWVNVSG